MYARIPVIAVVMITQSGNNERVRICFLLIDDNGIGLLVDTYKNCEFLPVSLANWSIDYINMIRYTAKCSP